MATTAAIPAPLVRAVHRFASPEDVEDTSDGSGLSVVVRGALLGTQRALNPKNGDVDGSATQVGIWGILRDDELPNTQQHLPGGISRIGLFASVRGAVSDASDALSSIAAKEAPAASPNANNTLVLVYALSSRALQLFRLIEGVPVPVELIVSPGLHAQDFHRAVGYAPLRCAVELHALGGRSDLQRQLARCEAATGSADSFFVQAAVGRLGKPRVVTSDGTDALTPGRVVTLEDILPPVEVTEMTKNKKKGKKSKQARQIQLDARENGVKEEDASTARFLPSLEYGNVAKLELLVALTSSLEGDAPVVTIPSPSTKPTARQSLYCDALVLVPVGASLQEALTLLRQQLHQQLTTLSTCLETASDTVQTVTMHQYPLIGPAFPISVVSTSDGKTLEDKEEDALLERLHRAFLQPLDQPLLRVSHGCSLAQQSEWLQESDVLMNVHEGLVSPGTSDEELALVDGFYGYYHYLQQGVNDKGWGCAYRSLQTLASWLFTQHFTQQRELSHASIQQALVRMGDKPARFQGSRDWIGSLEVGYVLDELFGVSFRSLSVPSGPQLVDVARELLHHFETQGTPVMMGGGQLAFTILGVAYDVTSGACSFLTLDPHYTGAEDLEAIQHTQVTLEGYKAIPCSWRKTSSFAKKSFYNFCLPQRPRVGV